MTKKLLAILFAMLMVITVMAGCQTTRTITLSDDSGYAEDEYSDSGDDSGDEFIETDETDSEGHAKTVRKTVRRTNRTKRKGNSGKTTVKKGGVAQEVTRTKRPESQTISFKPIPDAGADYSVKGEVSIAVDTVRVTDYEAMFDVMQKLYPNIKISYSYWAHNTSDTAQEYLATNFKTGTAADIIWDEAGRLPDYINNKWLYPLNDLIRKDPEAKYIPANLRKDFTYGGYLFAVPHQANFSIVAFNNDLMKRAGLTLPKMTWDYDQFEKYLYAASTQLYSKKLAIGMETLFDVGDRYANFCGKKQKPNIKWGENAVNLANGTIDADLLITGYKKFREYRVMAAGVEGWYEQQQKTGNKTRLNANLGVSTYTGLFNAGKALMKETDCTKVENIDFKFDMQVRPAPNVNGNLMLHVDHCFITSLCDKGDLPAAWQLLRFMTYSSNGNLARLSMYKPENQKKYVLNSHVYYPSSTNPAVIKAFNDLKCTNEVDEFMLAHIKNSDRIDVFKFIPDYATNYKDAQVGKAVNRITDGLDQGDTVKEAVDRYNKMAKESWDRTVANAKAAGKKYGVKAN